MINANFTAELHCRHGQVVVADTSFSAHPFTSADEDGWLSTEAARTRKGQKAFKPVAFYFEFLRQEENRTLYYISCAQHWDYQGARLERNSDGWLGLYGTHVAGRVLDALNPANLVRSREYWKIETLAAWDGDVRSAESISFYLRDKHGQRVAHTHPSGDKVALDYGLYLNASQLPGEVLEFQLRNIQLA